MVLPHFLSAGTSLDVQPSGRLLKRFSPPMLLKVTNHRRFGMKVKAKHILVEQEYEAQDLLKKLAEGKSFEELAQKFSKCPSGQRGGDLGEFGKGRMVAPFEEAAFGLDV